MSLATALPSLGIIGKEAQQKGIELLGYDFFGLVTKLTVFFIFAIIIDKVHWAINGTQNVIVMIANALGFKMNLAEPNFLKQLFSEEGFQGFHYWQIVNVIAITIVIIEMVQYINTNKKLGGKASPTTLAIFGLIVFLLTSFTMPDMIKGFQNKGLEAFR